MCAGALAADTRASLAERTRQLHVPGRPATARLSFLHRIRHYGGVGTSARNGADRRM